MKIEPAGHYILVKPDELTSLEQKELQKYEHLQKSGFSVNDLQDKKRKEKAINVGTLVAVGINAWKGFDDGIVVEDPAFNAKDLVMLTAETVHRYLGVVVVRRAVLASGNNVNYSKEGRIFLIIIRHLICSFCR